MLKFNYYDSDDINNILEFLLDKLYKSLNDYES